jgi:type IX secretion system PorP/SprF family membrane protein
MKNAGIILLFVLAFLPKLSEAQQDFLVSQTFVNPQLVNPSLSVLRDNWEVGVLVRNQWVSHDQSPQTQILTIGGTIGKPKSRRLLSGRIKLNQNTELAGGKRMFHTVSANVINDQVGAFGRMEAQLHWSPVVRLSKKLYAGIGPTLRFAKFQINPNRIDFLISNDQAWDMMRVAGLSHQSFGINVDGVIFTTNAYLGASLIDPLRATWVNDKNSKLLLDRALVLTGGVTHRLDRRWDIDAVLSNRMVKGAPIELDGMLRAVYQQSFWLGLGYRANAAFSVTVGSFLSNKLRCSYALERSMLSVSGQLGWSHEFYLSYVFPARSDLKF